MTIEHSTLVKNLAKPGQDIINDLNPKTAHILHMAIGVAGEASELLEAFLDSNREAALEELGDIEFYYEGLCQGVECQNIASTIPAENIKGDPLPYLLLTAGQVLDVAKKIAFYNDESCIPKLKEVMITFRGHLDYFYGASELKRPDAIMGNIKKLSKRYEEMTFSNKAAQNRVDKK